MRRCILSFILRLRLSVFCRAFALSQNTPACLWQRVFVFKGETFFSLRSSLTFVQDGAGRLVARQRLLAEVLVWLGEALHLRKACVERHGRVAGVLGHVQVGGPSQLLLYDQRLLQQLEGERSNTQVNGFVCQLYKGLYQGILLSRVCACVCVHMCFPVSLASCRKVDSCTHLINKCIKLARCQIFFILFYSMYMFIVLHFSNFLHCMWNVLGK